MTFNFKCPICDSSKDLPVYSGYRKCLQCDTVYSDHCLIDVEIVELYRDYGIPEKMTDEYLDSMLCRRDPMLQNIRRLRPSNGKIKILDIGCGWGGFMRHAKNNGYVVCGVDVGAGIENASKYGEIFKGNAWESPFWNLDVVVMNHTLEHVRQPVRMLKWIREALRPGGLLGIAVPNFNSLLSQLLKDQWGFLEPNLHQFQFTPVTLASLLKRCELRVIEMFTFNEGGYHIGDIAAGAAQAGIPVDQIGRMGLAEEIFCYCEM